MNHGFNVGNSILHFYSGSGANKARKKESHEKRNFDGKSDLNSGARRTVKEMSCQGQVAPY